MASFNQYTLGHVTMIPSELIYDPKVISCSSRTSFPNLRFANFPKINWANCMQISGPLSITVMDSYANYKQASKKYFTSIYFGFRNQHSITSSTYMNTYICKVDNWKLTMLDNVSVPFPSYFLPSLLASFRIGYIRQASSFLLMLEEVISRKFRLPASVANSTFLALPKMVSEAIW